LRTRTATAALLAVAALGIGACGDDEPAVDNSVTPAETAPAAGTVKLDISNDLSTKPAIPKLSGDPPAELVIQDVVKGKGEAVKAEDTITIQYVGVSFSTGKEFDSSWSRGEPATFPLGGLIPGWQQGIPGMRPGGRRVLIIPPEQAYGASPDPASGIAPNETLIFVIDLKEIA
jgi:peptidylprolyl isomerase